MQFQKKSRKNIHSHKTTQSVQSRNKIPLVSPFGGGRGWNTAILKIYDITGREVQTLVNESVQPGTYEVSFDGSGFNSGVYFYKLTAGDYSETKKMVLIK